MLLLFVEGRRAEESSGMIDDPDTTENSPSMRFAKRLFNIMDENKDGVLTMEEFVKGFHKLKVDGSNYGGVIVTAYVNERKLTKEDLLPKPAIPLRRKSLRRGSDLKLFKNDEAKPGEDDPDAKIVKEKGNDKATTIDAASIASAAKAATVISAKAKMHKKDALMEHFLEQSALLSNDTEGLEDVQAEVMNAASIALAAAKFKMLKEDKCTDNVAAEMCAKAKAKKAVRKIRKVWKINLFW